MDRGFAGGNAEGQVSLVEYCLGRVLHVQGRESLDPGRYAHFGRRKPGNVKQEFATPLAVVAKAGNPDDQAEAQRAYLAGMPRVMPREHVPYAHHPKGVMVLEQVRAPTAARDPPAQPGMVDAITAAVRPAAHQR